MKKYSRMMEIFWLISTIFLGAMAAYVLYRKGFQEGYLIVALPLVSGLMYGMRRWFRKRMEGEEDKN